MLLASGALIVAGTTPAVASVPSRDRVAAVSVDGPAGPATDSARRAKKRSMKRHVNSRIWSQRTLTYYEQVPAKWHWSLATAVAKWNAAGAKIRFVRVSTRAKARLVISYAHLGAKAGEATVGPTTHPWVHLSDAYRNVDATVAVNRIQVMGIFAHELGHVLGFEHTSTRCALMSPVLDVVGCGTVSDARPGYYKCATIGRSLSARLVKLYGGRTRAAGAPWCLIDPLPPTLTHVTFTGGDSPDVPVTVAWDVPSSAPAGSRVQVQSWTADSCGAPSPGASVDYVSMGLGSWRQAPGAQAGNECVGVALVNRYGVGRSRVAQKITPVAAGSQG